MTFDELRQKNVARCESPEGFRHRMSSWSVAEWTNAMCGEAGEAANIAKKMIRPRDNVAGNIGEDAQVDILKLKLARELADVVIYADLVAASQGIDLGVTVKQVWNAKSSEIGYPRRLGVPSKGGEA